MAKYPSERHIRRQHVPSAPPPSSASASEGMERAHEMARRYLPNDVLLWAGVAFAPDNEASLWTRVQSARLFVAGAIPQAVPEAPRPHDEDGGEAMAHDVLTDNEATGSFAAQRRRASRREEWNEHIWFAEMLEKYHDPSCTFWTSLENKPLSPVSGVFQKKRGVKSGLPEVLVLSNGKTVFVESKSRRGVASKAQKQIRAEVLPAGATGGWREPRALR